MSAEDVRQKWERMPQLPGGWREMVSYIERDEPELWKLCYPRIYRDADQYCAPRIPALLTASTFIGMEMDFENRDDSFASSSLRNVFLAHVAQSRYGLPKFFVERELLDALLLSDPDPGIKWMDLQLPFEAATFMLPKGYFTHPTDGPCDYLSYARFKRGQLIDGSLMRLMRRRHPHFPEVALEHDSFIVFTVPHEDKSFPVLERCMNADYNPTISTEGLSELEATHIRKTAWFDTDLTRDENLFLDRLTGLTFRLLLFIMARPDYVISGRKTGIHKKSHQEIWEPRILGKGFRFRTERSEPQGGTHASPRFHFRRGHFRNQSFGEKHTKRKIIFIKPTEVGE